MEIFCKLVSKERIKVLLSEIGSKIFAPIPIFSLSSANVLLSPSLFKKDVVISPHPLSLLENSSLCWYLTREFLKLNGFIS